MQTVNTQKKFYSRETMRGARISRFVKNPATLSWFAEIIEVRKGLIIRVA
jgi:hypothetical protein